MALRTTDMSTWRRARHRALALVAAVALAACSGSAPTSSGSPAAASSAPAGSAGSSAAIDTTPLIWVHNSPPDLGYLPILMAIKDLNDQGYKITSQVLKGSDLTTQAITSNQAQFTSDGLSTGAFAVDKGGSMIIIGTREKLDSSWVSTQEFADCSKLNDKPVGIFAKTAIFTVLQEAYFNDACPGVKPTYLVIPDSTLRAQALVAGQIVGTVLAGIDVVQLQTQYPNKFNIVEFNKRLPGLADTYLYSNADTLSNHESVVSAFLAAQLKAIRSLYANKDQIAGLAKQFSIDATPQLVDHYLQSKLWYANGGLEGDGLAKSLQTLKLPGTPDKLENAKPMQDALAVVGRSDATER